MHPHDQSMEELDAIYNDIEEAKEMDLWAAEEQESWNRAKYLDALWEQMEREYEAAMRQWEEELEQKRQDDLAALLDWCRDSHRIPEEDPMYKYFWDGEDRFWEEYGDYEPPFRVGLDPHDPRTGGYWDTTDKWRPIRFTKTRANGMLYMWSESKYSGRPSEHDRKYHKEAKLARKEMDPETYFRRKPMRPRKPRMQTWKRNRRQQYRPVDKGAVKLQQDMAQHIIELMHKYDLVVLPDGYHHWVLKQEMSLADNDALFN